jgi:hypothetical protein
MANADRPCGFRPHGKILRANVYESGAAIYPGDAVKLSSDGQIDPAAAGDALLGVALSYASAAGAEVLVADDPSQRFVVQADETQVDAQTDIGNVCDIVATAGNSTYKLSRMELDSSDVNTTSGQLCILGYERRADNALGTNVDAIVKINEHQLKDAFAGV